MSFDLPAPPYNASDPHARFLSSSCLDFLIIELVPLAHRLAAEAAAAASSPSSSTSTSPLDSVPPERVGTNTTTAATGAAADKPGGATAARTNTTGLDDEDEREQVFVRLDALGYRVGLGLVERFSRDRPRFTDQLDVIKFLCKDLWMLVFRKQIDNLKTNHRGVYVLTDHSFRSFSRMSLTRREEAVAKAQPYLYFPCGIIRGALASMGIEATVQAETTELPGATFQIRTVGGTGATGKR